MEVSPIRHRIVAIALEEVGSRGGQKYGKEGLWCGAFVVWCLREAGLKLESGHSKPGENLCKNLPVVMNPEPGDIVRYQNDHCAIVLSYFADHLRTVDGTHSDGLVTKEMRLPHTPMTFYSIDELIRCYEMTGAETPEVD